MSGRDEQRADPGGSEDPSRRVSELLSWGGLAAIAFGALLRIGADRGAETLRLAGAGIAIAGVAAMVAGRFVRRGSRRAPPPGYATDAGAISAKRLERLVLAGLGGACAATGLVLLLVDALDEEQHGAAWPFLVTGSISLVIAGIWTAAASEQPRDVVLGPPEPPSRRAWIAAAVGALLVAQALIPLRYYLGDDRYDERFSWRMFSAVRVYSCDLTAYETRGGAESPTNLSATIHVAWINTLRRNREAVMRRYLEWRCEQEDIEAARLVNVCTSPEGERQPDVVRRIDCADGVVLDGAAEAEAGR